MGAGALGSYIGGCLLQKGHEVLFVTRGDQLSAIKDRGLTINDLKGKRSIINVHATDRPGNTPFYDLILFCVKSYDNPDAIELIGPLAGPQSVILTFQSGIDSLDELVDAFSSSNVLGGICWSSFVLQEPGVSEQISPGRFVIGEVEGGRSNRADGICEIFRDAGIETIIDEEIVKSMWEKFVFNCAYDGLTALTGLSVGVLLGFSESKELFISVLREVEKVARRSGILLSEKTIDNILYYLEYEILPEILDNTYGSMYYDIKKGKNLELDAINGSVVRRGRQIGVPTPVNNVIYAALRPRMENDT